MESKPDTGEYPATVFHQAIEQRPEQIVSFSPAITAMLLDLDYTSRLAGVSTYCETLSDELPSAVGTALLPDWEAMEQVQPDILLTMTPLSQFTQKRLEEMGILILQVDSPLTWEDWLDTCREICILLDGALSGQENGERFVEQVSQSLGQIRDGIDAYLETSGEPRQTALYLQDLPFTVATGDTLENSLLEAAGLVNAAKHYQNWAFPPEGLEENQPDIVLVNQEADLLSEPHLEEYPVLQSLTAVSQGRIFPVDGLLLEQPSLKWIDLIQELASFAYPDADFDG